MAARSLALAVGLSVALASCSGPQEQAAEAPVLSTAALDSVAAQETVVAFLEAYAGSGGLSLAELVSGPELADWAHWVEVQNRGLPGTLEGSVDLRAIRVLRLDEDFAAVAVDATVDFVLEGGTGEEASLAPRRFHSPVILARLSGPSRWAVFDVARDGRAMSDSIIVFDPPPAAAGQGLEVEVVSLYRFSTGTAVNLRIRNRTPGPVSLDIPHSVLQVNGRFMGAIAATPGFESPLPPKETVEGALNFAQTDLATLPEIVMVRLEGSEGPVEVPLPPEAFLPEG